MAVLVLLKLCGVPDFVEFLSLITDFHTFKLQLPIQIPLSVAPKLEVFVSSFNDLSKL